MSAPEEASRRPAGRRDPMRTLGWWLVGVGLTIAVLSPVYVFLQWQSLDERMHRAAMSGSHYVYDAFYRQRESMSAWPIAIAGAAATAFGVLLLAIRRPRP